MIAGPGPFAPSWNFWRTGRLLSFSGADLSQVVAVPNLAGSPQFYRATPSGLSPSQVRQAYAVDQIGFNNAVAGDGSGQTIAIVVAYDDPNIGSDLKQFDRQFGLADPPSFTKYVQAGLTRSDPGWALETALDVEWAHAMAPKANIALVEARTRQPERPVRCRGLCPLAERRRGRRDELGDGRVLRPECL